MRVLCYIDDMTNHAVPTRNDFFTSPETGRVYWIDADGLAAAAYDEYEGLCCLICDGLGHGYPGGGPCPLEERGYEDARRDEEREAYFA